MSIDPFELDPQSSPSEDVRKAQLLDEIARLELELKGQPDTKPMTPAKKSAAGEAAADDWNDSRELSDDAILNIWRSELWSGQFTSPMLNNLLQSSRDNASRNKLAFNRFVAVHGCQAAVEAREAASRGEQYVPVVLTMPQN